MKLKGLGRGLDALLAGNESAGKEQQRICRSAVCNLENTSRVHTWMALRWKSLRPRSGRRG